MFQGSIFKFDRHAEEFEVWRVPDELEQPKGAHGTRIFQINHAAPESSHVDGKVWLQNRSIAGVHRLDLSTGEFESFEPFLGSSRRSHNLYGIHPTAEGHRIIAATVWQTLEPLLQNLLEQPTHTSSP